MVHMNCHKKSMAYCCVLCEMKTFSLEDFQQHAKEHVLQTRDNVRKETASFPNDIVNSIEMINVEGCDFEVHVKAKSEDFHCSLCGENLSHWLLARKHAMCHKG